MRRPSEAGLFVLAVAALLAFQFRAAWAEGHLLYPAVIEDPAARYSFLPWDVHAGRMLHAGEFPLWNSLSGAGAPLLANLQSSVLNPLKWPYYLFRAPRLLDLFVLARLALAAGFLFALARELGRSRPGAAAAGLALALSGYLMKHQNMVNLSSEMWLPLLMLLALRQRRRPSRANLLCSALAFALVLVGGNPEAAAYVIAIDTAFILVMARGRTEIFRLGFSAFLAPLALGGLIAGPQLLPFVEYLGAGWHIHDPNLAQMGRLPAGLVGSLVAPWLLGPGGTTSNQLLAAPHLGAAVLLLALLGGTHAAGADRPGRFFAGLLLVLLGVVYALPGFDLILRLPPLDRFGNGKFAMFGATLAAAMLAGAGVDAVRSAGLKPRLTALALAGASLLFLVGGISSRRFGAVVPAGVFTPLVALVGSAAVVFLGLRRQRAGGEGRAAGRRASVLVAVLALELCVLYYGFRRDTSFPTGMARPESPEVPPALAPLAEDPGARFVGVGGVIHPNLNLLVGLADFRSFDGLYPRNYVEALGRIEGFGLDRAVENFFSHGWMFDVRPGNLGADLLDRYAVGYVVSGEEVVAPGFSLVRSGDYRVYRNDQAWPRARTEPGDVGTAGAAAFVPAKIFAETSGRVEVEAWGPGRLILADTYFPGWRAEVDGRAVAVIPAEGFFRAVELGAGDHRVAFKYEPVGFRVGLWAGVSALVALILAPLLSVFRKVRAKSEAPGR